MQKEERIAIRSSKDKGCIVVQFDSSKHEPDWHADLNAFLFKFLMSEIPLASGKVWACSAMLASRHISAGILHGTSSSSFSETNALHRASPTTSTLWLTGGTFGIERSNITLLLCSSAIAIVGRHYRQQFKEQHRLVKD